MIRVTIELISAVDPSKDCVLGRMIIRNDGTGTQEVGNYTAELHADYTHRRQQSVWSLVGAFLKLWGHTKHSPKDMFKN